MILTLLLFPLLSFATVVQDDVSTTEKNPFSFKTVCQKMVTHESPLIEVVSGSELDCMGKKVDVGVFCDKEMAADPYYLRAYMDKVKKEVICHSGKKVLFKFQCVKMFDRHLCEDEAKKSCAFIKQKLAKRLDLVHASQTKTEKGIKELNCYFESLPLKENTIGL
jgi:hypothetical protein